MLLIAPIPPGWFTNELSEDACKRFGARIIKANEWETLDKLYSIRLPKDFDLDTYVRRSRLHAVYFIFENSTHVLIHPDKLLRLGCRQLRKFIERNRIPPE